jgi:hypothetical protein
MSRSCAALRGLNDVWYSQDKTGSTLAKLATFIKKLDLRSSELQTHTYVVEIETFLLFLSKSRRRVALSGLNMLHCHSKSATKCSLAKIARYNHEMTTFAL